MPRAHRHFLAGQVWHVTHRCHERAFLLQFARDRRRYLQWLFEAKKRFGLCVLDYMVTCNHIHLLLKDNGSDVIAHSMQLIAGRTAQEFNQRKTRKGAFWEDRYHATAIGTDEHLLRCIVYIDMNMVRAGVVRHPRAWPHSGYNELQQPPERYALIDLPCLAELCGFSDIATFQSTHRSWIDTAVNESDCRRDASWTEAIAVGSQSFVTHMKNELGSGAAHRVVKAAGVAHVLREPVFPYDAVFPAENHTLQRQFQALNCVAKTKIAVVLPLNT
jgi:putative transposase